MKKFDLIEIKKRGKNHKIRVTFNAAEVGEHGTWDPKWIKETNQFLSSDLSNCIERLSLNFINGYCLFFG